MSNCCGCRIVLNCLVNLLFKRRKMSKENNAEAQNPQWEERPIPTWMQVRCGILANLSILSPGINLGFPAIVVPTLTDLSNPIHLTIDQASWIVSISAITMPLGCLIAGPIIDKWGRKATLYTINVVMIIGWGIISFASTSNTHDFYVTLLFGRLIAGIGTGLCSVPATIYMSEISTPDLRGMFIMWSSAYFALGVLIVYILGYIFKNNWKMCAIISGILPIFVIIIVFFFLPESPIWLKNKGQTAAAEKSLKKLKGLQQKPAQTNMNQNVNLNGNQLINNPPIITISNSINRGTNVLPLENKKSIFKRLKENINYFSEPECWKPFLIMTSYFFFQQFSGNFVVVVYAVEVIKKTGVQLDPYIAAIMIGTVRAVTTFLVSCVSRKFGRRLPSIISGVGMTICMFLLAIFLYITSPETSGTPPHFQITPSNVKFEHIDGSLLEKSNSTSSNSSIVASTSEFLIKHFKWLPLLFIMLYFLSAAIGFLVLPFAMIGEVFPMKVRGVASSTVACFCYTSSFVIIKLYPIMVQSFGSAGVFLFYAAVAFLGTIFIYVFLPETEGKTLEQIENGFKKRRE